MLLEAVHSPIIPGVRESGQRSLPACLSVSAASDTLVAPAPHELDDADKPIGKSTVHRILTNPYYKGDVRYNGATYKGSHEPIVPREVWYQVQTVLDSHKSAADATQVHDHYLKGTVYCGQCGSRLIICNARNGQGKVYPYFVCSGRHGGKGDCTRQAMLIEDVEHLVESYYETIQVSGETRQDLAGMLHAEFDRLMASETKELGRLANDRDRLDDEHMKLLQAHYAGAVPLDLLKKEQDRISAELETITNRIAAHHDEYAEARANRPARPRRGNLPTLR